MDFKHCRWSMLVWQGYCSFPIPWWRKHAYKNRRREKSLFTQQKVRKKERTIHQHTGADRNIHTSHTHFTSQCQTTAWGEQYMRSAIPEFGCTEKKKVKILSVPWHDLMNKIFPLCRIPFCAWYRLSVVWDTCFKNSAFSGLWGILSLLCPGWSAWPDKQRWAKVELLSTTRLLNIWSILLLPITGTDAEYEWATRESKPTL